MMEFSSDIRKYNNQEVAVTSFSPLVNVSKMFMNTADKSRQRTKAAVDPSNFMYAKKLGEALGEILLSIGLKSDESLDMYVWSKPDKFSFLAKNLGSLKRFTFTSVTYLEDFEGKANYRNLGEFGGVFIHCSRYEG